MALEYPDDLKYLDSHEYARVEGTVVTIGISAFAVDQLGDIVFVELPEVGESVEKAARFGTIESVKAVEDLNSPLNGTVVEINEAVVDAPELIGDDPYGEGWLIRVEMDNPVDLDDTMTASEYQEQVEGE